MVEHFQFSAFLRRRQRVILIVKRVHRAILQELRVSWREHNDPTPIMLKLVTLQVSLNCSSTVCALWLAHRSSLL